MDLERAMAVAKKYETLLDPLCERIAIAGSVRRRRPFPGDIEIVCIPKMRDMYEFAGIVNSWPAVKCKPTGHYTQRLLPEGIKLDLFIATRDNWGLIFAIRTGSKEYSHRVLAAGWVKKGFKSEAGVLVDYKGYPHFIREEEELFELIGVPFLDPTNREI